MLAITSLGRSDVPPYVRVREHDRDGSARLRRDGEPPGKTGAGRRSTRNRARSQRPSRGDRPGWLTGARAPRHPASCRTHVSMQVSGVRRAICARRCVARQADGPAASGSASRAGPTEPSRYGSLVERLEAQWPRVAAALASESADRQKEIALHAALAALRAVGTPKPVDDPHALAAECHRLDALAWGPQEDAPDAYESAFRIARECRQVIWPHLSSRILAPAGTGGLAGAESVGVGAGLDDVGVEGDAVDDRGDQAGVGEDGSPFAEGQVGRDGDGGSFFAFGDDLEEQFGAAGVEVDVAEFVEAAAGRGGRSGRRRVTGCGRRRLRRVR